MSTPLRLDHTFFENEVRPHLGSVLVRLNLLRPEQLDRALEIQRGTGKRLGEVLLELGWIFEQDIARAIATQFDLKYVDLEALSIDSAAARKLDPEVGQRLRAIPIRFDTNGLVVAVADPAEAPRVTLVAETGMRVELCIGEASVIVNAWRRLLRGQRP